MGLRWEVDGTFMRLPFCLFYHIFVQKMPFRFVVSKIIAIFAEISINYE